ncbi:LmeA family phospholipid-binding protein [Nostoc sp. B(2019)]|nr:LmeA family phospholipid-binding protein [Nostoc sp. B(2019)]
MPDEQRFEEQLLSQEAERMVSQQLDKVEQIDIDVQTDLLKIVQGQADGVSFTGQGLTIKEDIRVQEIKLQTDSIAINPLSALFGQIELNQPVNTIARIVLLETDINCALSSDFVRSKLQSYDLKVDSEIVSLEPQEIQIFLPDSGKLEFRVKVLLKEMGNTRPLSFMGMVRPRTHSQPLMLESFNCTQGEGVSIELVVAIMQKIKELVNLPSFKWEDMVFRIKDLEVEKGIMTLMIETQVRQIPSSSTVISPE